MAKVLPHHGEIVISAPLYSTDASVAASRSAGGLLPALIQRTLNVRVSGMPGYLPVRAPRVSVPLAAS